ncbi:MAG: restriction endonuclease, partial [Ruminiclostridium sp.]|nr:restriction endonuclease [Ruminiclostridium sp.]
MDIKDELRVWGIHTRYDNIFLQNNVIAVGWEEMGNLGDIKESRDDFKAEYSKIYRDATKGSIATNAGQLYRFVCEANIGDYVVYPSKNDRKINIGIIESDYFYADSEKIYPNRRNVKWLKQFPRTAFSQGALYEVGAAQTWFLIKNYAEEFISVLKGKMPGEVDDTTISATADEINQNTKDYILKALSKNLKGYPLENFVANLLEAMGYRTTVSQQGGDSGIDIIAYKDELPPRILVQVKSNDKAITESVVSSFGGTMRPGDYGLFVTLSDYMPNAKKYLEQNPQIKGISGYELVDLVLKYYDKLDEKYQKVIPLKMVYIPVGNNEL